MKEPGGDVVELITGKNIPILSDPEVAMATQKVKGSGRLYPATLKPNGNILFFSQDRSVYDDLVAYLGMIQSTDYPCFIDTIDQLEKNRHLLKKCDLMICCPNENPLLLELAAQLLESEAGFIPLMLVHSGPNPLEMINTTPAFLRVTGTIDLSEGWDASWNSLKELQQVWRVPVMHSRIEEVSPSDVLQMIGISQWTAIVRLDGSGSHAAPVTLHDPAKIKGCIVFNHGVPECAWSTHFNGSEAIWELLSLTHGTLDVIRRPWGLCIKNVHSKIDEIIISYALKVDGFPVCGEMVHDMAEETAPQVRSEEPPPPPPPASLELTWLKKTGDLTGDPWWKSNADAIAATLDTFGTRPAPLRWMRGREVERLLGSKEDKKFLVYRSDKKGLASLLAACGGAAEMADISDEDIPVLRLGRFGTTVLYIIGLFSAETTVKPPRGYPLVIVHCKEMPESALVRALDSTESFAVIVSSDRPAAEKAAGVCTGNASVALCLPGVSTGSDVPVVPVLREVVHAAASI
jgi:hypothetical protein